MRLRSKGFDHRKCIWGQKIKIWKLYQMGSIICKMIRGLRIWPQNSNRITFEPHFGQKKLSNLGIFENMPRKSQDSTMFWPKEELNVIWFEFCGQIWNPLIILHIIDPIWYNFQILIFWPPCIWADAKMLCAGWILFFGKNIGIAFHLKPMRHFSA